MKILVLYVDKIPASPLQIRCFSDVWTHYLISELAKHTNVDTKAISSRFSDDELIAWFNKLDVQGYDAVIALGLRYFSTVPRIIGENLRQKLYPGILCQIHDGSRLDNDPVDLTFTLKQEDHKYPFDAEANRYVRHHSYNAYVGWAADPNLNRPNQSDTDLRILVDHTNYGNNPVDLTLEILQQIKTFRDSMLWKSRFSSMSVRRFDSGRMVDVDLDNLGPIERYDRTAIPFTEVCAEHSQAHVFCVTHPESVGLVVLETAMAGALTVAPKGFIPKDRLNTVKHVEWDPIINWRNVMHNINPRQNRLMAMENSWERVAKRMRSILAIRRRIRGQHD